MVKQILALLVLPTPHPTLPHTLKGKEVIVFKEPSSDLQAYYKGQDTHKYSHLGPAFLGGGI